jgi:hypothetical protein
MMIETLLFVEPRTSIISVASTPHVLRYVRALCYHDLKLRRK